MEFVFPILFFVAIVVQLIYILFIFTKLIGHNDFEADKNQGPVSIIIAASNELQNLKELLPLLENQDYPEFEILVADDRSNDGTYDYLLLNEGKFKKMNLEKH